ncbi:MAG: hypothetical protein RL071_1149 [Pseudomonadota bacterium]
MARRAPPVCLIGLALAAGCAGEPGKGGADGGGADSGGAPLSVCAGDACVEPQAGGGLLLRFAGEARLSLPADAVAVGVEDALIDTRSYDPTYPQAATRWAGLTEWGAPAAVDGGIELALRGADGGAQRLRVEAGPDGAVALRLVPTEAPPGGVVVAYRVAAAVTADEGLYGLGEWFDRPEHRGAVRPMHIVADLESESSYNEAHVPVPLLIGTRGWGLFAETDRPTVFDVAAADPERVQVEVGVGPAADEGLRLHLLAAAEALDVTAAYTALTGRPRLPAPWALGPLLWRDENIDQTEVLADVHQIRDLDLAASGVWIDRPYATAVNTFDFNPATYSDPGAMVAEVHSLGLRLALWHTPYLEPEGAAALHAEAQAAGYFPPNVPIIFNGWSEPLDFTNPAAVTWWQGLLGAYGALGVEGYKLDYGEDVILGLNGNRLGWVFADGSDERTMHKGYMRGYHSTYAATLPEDGGFLLCRAGTWGDQVNVNVIWPGDLDADMAYHREPREDGSLSVGGLPAAVAAAAGLGPSGFPFFASDTGGYRHSPPSAETFIRWAQHTALTPTMQVGNSASLQPWELLGGAELDHYRDLSRLHQRLFPFIWTEALALEGGGRPLLRPFGLQEPQWGQHPADQYFFGEDLLVAPVVRPGQTTRALVRPAGDWVGWFDGAPLPGAPGALVTVDAPLLSLPLFLRAGALIPLLRPTIDTLAPVDDPEAIDSFATDPGRLWARAAAGGSGAAAVYDGAALRLDDDGATVRVEMTPGAVFRQGLGLELVGLGGPPSGVEIDGAASEAWSYAGGVLTIPEIGAVVQITR